MSKQSKALKIAKKTAKVEKRAENKAYKAERKEEKKTLKDEKKAAKVEKKTEQKAAKVEAKQLKRGVPGATTTASMASMPVGSSTQSASLAASGGSPATKMSVADRLAARLLAKQAAKRTRLPTGAGRGAFVIKKAGY